MSSHIFIFVNGYRFPFFFFKQRKLARQASPTTYILKTKENTQKRGGAKPNPQKLTKSKARPA
jgi:hypothetical protein